MCLGGQKNFQHFMQRLKDEPPPPIDTAWFKRLIALAVLYRAITKKIRSMKFPAYGAPSSQHTCLPDPPTGQVAGSTSIGSGRSNPSAPHSTSSLRIGHPGSTPRCAIPSASGTPANGIRRKIAGRKCSANCESARSHCHGLIGGQNSHSDCRRLRALPAHPKYADIRRKPIF